MADNHDGDCPRVLMIAEKPSVALAIADALSHGKKRTRGLRPLVVHDLYFYYPPARAKCSISVTSVVGHIFSLDFDGSSKSRELSSVYAQ